MTFRPMLACNAVIEEINYPVLATAKLDGIRTLIKDGRCISRNLKDIPNHYVRETLIELLGDVPGILDGEVICGTFNETSSGVMSRDGEPDFKYWIFDYVSEDFNTRYDHRMTELHDLMMSYDNDVLGCLLPIKIDNYAELQVYEEQCVNNGFEGCMTRSPDGHYKQGRSTPKDGGLLWKVKRFEDAEAKVIGFEELMHNNNEKSMDNLGYADRSTCKENMVPMEMLGSLKVRDIETGIEFNIGSGFTADQRKEIWMNQYNYVGKLVTYKHQKSGAKEAPRFPVFKGFRHENDLS